MRRLLCVLALGLLLRAVGGQLSKAVAHDSHIFNTDNKFLKRTASNDHNEWQLSDITPDASCPLDVELKWMTEVSSSVYATPLITDLYSDGKKDIIVPAFVHYLEVLEGDNGGKALGWPAFHKSTVHSSPLLYDWDLDGVRDIVVATYDGEVLAFKDTGEKLLDSLQVPRLKVRRDWYVGLKPDPTDHTHLDVGGAAGNAGENLFQYAAQHAKGRIRSKHEAKAALQGKQPPRAPQLHHPQQPHQQQPHQPAPHHATAQQPDPKQPQEPQPRPQQATQPPARSHPEQPLDPQLQAAVLKFRAHLRTYTEQYGKAAADALLEDTKTKSPKVYAVVKAQLKEEAAMADLLGSVRRRRLMQLVEDASGSADATRHGSNLTAAAVAERRLHRLPGWHGDAHDDPHLMEQLRARIEQDADRVHLSDEEQSWEGAPHQPYPGAAAGALSSSRAGGEGAAGLGGSQLAGTRRRLLQEDRGAPKLQPHRDQRQQQAGGAPKQQQQQQQGGAPKATVETDPNSKGGLSQEALDSFALFEDNPSSSSSGGGAADGGTTGAAGGSTTGSESAGAAGGKGGGKAGGSASGHAAGAAAGKQQPAGGGAVGLGLPAKTAYDEFGDELPSGDLRQQKLEVAAAGKEAGDVDHQLQDEFSQLFGGDYVVGDGKFPNAADWEDEAFSQVGRRSDGEYVWVDAHVLCTPAIADIDGDGHDEIVLAVSYFFDKDYYDNPTRAKDLGDVAKDKYVAGGIVVYDLRTKMLKWHQQLDLTTDTTRFKAHIFSSPTLVDINQDGLLEIVVGTSLGFVYALDSQGHTLEGWPIQMGEVQGQVLVGDLNNDGAIEVFAADSLGNIALFNAKGKELWERHVKTMVAQGAVAGDLDGDGLLEVVFGTVDGKVYAVQGADGKDKRGFPYQTTGRVQAQPTIVQLNTKKPNVQHIAIMSFDGLLYLIDGSSGCAHTVDIGEASYSAVLVDDLDGDGALQLLVSTMNGNVYCMDTRTPYHPLKTWPAQVQGLNGQVARWNYFGVFAGLASRQPRDVVGQKLQVELNIVDQRKLLHHGRIEPLEDLGPYSVTVVLKGVGVAEMNAGPQPVIGVADSFPKPGKYVVEVPCPRTRTTAAVYLDVMDKHGLHYEDEYVVSFHIHFHKLLKWLVALPMLAMAVVLLAVAQSAEFADAVKNYHLG